MVWVPTFPPGASCHAGGRIGISRSVLEGDGELAPTWAAAVAVRAGQVAAGPELDDVVTRRQRARPLDVVGHPVADRIGADQRIRHGAAVHAQLGVPATQ